MRVMSKLALVFLMAFGVLTFGVSALAEKPALRWGADFESGAPYAFKAPGDPNKIIGFEAEIVHELGRRMGREVAPVQNNWDGLVEGLERKDYDIVVNGLEITPERARVVNFSIPYYITSEVLTVRKTSADIHDLADLKGRRVGTLDGSLAQRILEKSHFPGTVVPYNEEVNLYNDLGFARVDGVLLDAPVALYYGNPNPMLKTVGGPVGRMEYGIAVRKGDTALLAEINMDLRQMIQDGTLRHILERWGLWNQMTADEWKMDPTPRTPALEYQEYLKTAYSHRPLMEKVKLYASFLPLLGKGALMTMEISILSMALAMMVGLLTALLRLYGPTPMAWTAVSFIEVMRGTPLLIQLYLIFYGLPHIGLRLNPFLAAVIGLGLNYGASEAENYRAGIVSIPKAQMDASQALGMSWFQSMRFVVLPQAVRVVIPPVTNDFISLLKDSSLVSVISMVELTTTYGQLASTYFDYLGIGLLTAGIYFLLGLPFVRLSHYFETHLNTHLNNKPVRR